MVRLDFSIDEREVKEAEEVKEVEDAEHPPPPPRVFCGKRLQTIENKGNKCRKECKERTKRLQEYESNGFATEAQRAQRGFWGRREYTPVVTGSMRRLLRTERMRALRGACDGDDEGSSLVCVFAASRPSRRGGNFVIWAGTGATKVKGSAGVFEK